MENETGQSRGDAALLSGEALLSDAFIEAACKAHCDYFGGEGWWETGLIAETRPRALAAMRKAIIAAIATGEA